MPYKECENCGKGFDKPANLRRHLVRKNPCRPPTRECTGCGGKFATYKTLWQHRSNRCPEGVEDRNTEGSKKKAATRNRVLVLERRVVELEEEVASLLGRKPCGCEDSDDDDETYF